ncbi:MAG: DUF2161 family putative PD-(D/E)XK-type phosphodiesterase [Aestuariivirga sp.]
MRETDLYRPIKRFLEAQGYEVKAEIKSCDVVAVRGDEAPVLVELKTSFSLQLLLQGIDRQAISDAVYLAVAEPKKQMRRDLIKLCRRLGLGLLTVRGESVEAHADPVSYTPRKNARRKELLLKEFTARAGDPNLGGSTRAPLMTAYRQDALRCARVLQSSGKARVAEIRKQAQVDRAASILLRDVYGWFVREARGVYALRPEGKQALMRFSSVLPLL